jgi:MFS family permease
MRPEIATAERAAAVRAAAAAWHRAGWIGADARAAIARAYADDRQRMGRAMRILLFGLTLFGIAAAAGTLSPFLAMAEFPAGGFAFLGGCAGLVFVVLSEVARNSWRMRGVGVESALSWAGLGGLLGAWAWFAAEPLGLDGQAALLAILGGVAVAFSAGAWRWGSWPKSVVATLAVFGILAGFPAGRILWIGFGGALAAVGLATSERASWAPPHRDVARTLSLLGLLAIALAVFPASNEHRWIETLGLRRDSASPIPDGLTGIATAFFAAAVIGVALRTRRRALLGGGVLLLAALAGHVVDAFDLGPGWAIACAAGAFLVAGALALRRLLDSGPNGERGGFTSRALLEDAESRRLLESALVLASASPDARSLPASNQGAAVSGRGGEFGGGGSSGSF